ncbi:hypothetical protein C8F01DRAFT_1138362 [Mycena amicta]|nr:hypothetical protein C8F01DRAFT_1138362 [Mycena amicta]
MSAKAISPDNIASSYLTCFPVPTFHGHPDEDVHAWLNRMYTALEERGIPYPHWVPVVLSDASGHGPPVLGEEVRKVVGDVWRMLGRMEEARLDAGSRSRPAWTGNQEKDKTTDQELWWGGDWHCFARVLMHVHKQAILQQSSCPTLASGANANAGAFGRFKASHPYIAAAATMGLIVLTPVVGPPLLAGIAGIVESGVVAGSLAATVQAGGVSLLAMAQSVGAGGAALVSSAPVVVASAVGTLGAWIGVTAGVGRERR